MNLLVFDLIGKFGHFRKFYSNSSALSFGIPPRTTLCGIIAALLGKERDSYYSLFNLNDCKIAVSCKMPIRKTIHKLNYLYIENVNNLNASYGNPTQVPFEILSAPLLGKKNIKYRVFFAHNDAELFSELRNRLKKKENEFALSLGSASFTAYYEFLDEVNLAETRAKPEIAGLISSAVPVDKITDYFFDKNMGKSIVTELIPLQFNIHRELIALKEVLYCEHGEALFLKLKTPFFQVNYLNRNETENIVFME